MKNEYFTPVDSDWALASGAAFELRARLVMDLLRNTNAMTSLTVLERADGTPHPRLLTPIELVERVVAIADETVSAFEREGWIVASPPPEVHGETPRVFTRGEAAPSDDDDDL